MEINLLPQKPSLFQPAWVIWGTACLIFVASATYIPIYYHSLIVQKTSLEQQQASLTALQNTLRAQHNKVDPRSEQLLQYKAELNLLDQKQVNWQTRLQTLANQLPATGTITNLTYKGNSIAMDGNLDSVKTVVQFIELLKKVAWIQSVTLTSVTNNAKNLNSSSGEAGIFNSNMAGLPNQGVASYKFSLKIQTSDPLSEQTSGGSKQ